ncbi:hypothetical protein EDEG_04039 [Edhazardia aedis USNM 41457]|uniref:Transmembrane protein n=1 Tax=Edhazardia aedis (strain USNM 41457) TaxID=1003232 RepID=J9D061_EDHAE|nr:hypothetical protein EDEG_04039 [Edhazardia aedis USNM 41457]|eukprot:EJW01256.1 hypothetical protein EDEG_04039 [Edhazardia aedis USNM 41457]
MNKENTAQAAKECYNRPQGLNIINKTSYTKRPNNNTSYLENYCKSGFFPYFNATYTSILLQLIVIIFKIYSHVFRDNDNINSQKKLLIYAKKQNKQIKIVIIIL